MTTADRVIQALEPHGLKQEGTDKYRCNSPFRPNSDSMTFVLKIEGAEHGTFFDHHPSATPASGSLYDLAKLLSIPIPTAIPVESTKRGYEGLEDYARAHGLPGDYLRRWSWRETVHSDRPALEFMTQTGSRWRFLDGAKGKPVYISTPGYTRCWYGLSDELITSMKESSNRPLVICNGEISTIAGRFHGLLSICMTGGEKGEIPVELFEQLTGKLSSLTTVKILIALDCDKAGRAAARGLESQFKRAGYDAAAIDLGFGHGGDLADFCKLYGQESEKRLLDSPPLPQIVESSKWKFAKISDLLKLPPVEWLIPRLLPSRGLTMLYGASGSYKSFFALDFALKLALEGKNVLYIAAEGESGYKQRVEAWIKHHKQTPSEDHITFVLSQVDMFDAEDREEFARTIERYKPDLIIVDTFAMCSGLADENSSRDMLTIVQGCKAMSQQFNGVIVMVHHTNKEGKQERGSQVLRNSCDTVIRVSLEDNRIAVESQKTKDTEKLKRYYLAPVQIQLGYIDNLNQPVTSVVLEPAANVLPSEKLTEKQSRVLKHLSIEPSGTLADIAEAVEERNRGVIGDVIQALVKKGLVKITDGKREVTKEGLATLDSFDSSDSLSFQKQQSDMAKESRESKESKESVNGDLPGFNAVKFKRNDQYSQGA